VVTCVVAASGLAATYAVTKDRIAEQDRLAQENSLKASLPEAERKKMVAKMEASFKESAKEVRATVESDEFLQNCRASWQDPSKMPKALKEELARCLSLPDCEGYATCFMDSAALSP
ncbi:MAG TPA: hypothetical protein PLJ27_24370, partial [Polyangiaceae bacterium]|nr:hypothetical protein [Polyangiaceae bacterium]